MAYMYFFILADHYVPYDQHFNMQRNVLDLYSFYSIS